MFVGKRSIVETEPLLCVVFVRYIQDLARGWPAAWSDQLCAVIWSHIWSSYQLVASSGRSELHWKLRVGEIIIIFLTLGSSSV